MIKNQRVIALMSGGVDSSVSAALLKQQGYDVIGVYILGWTGDAEFPCNWQQEEADARAVANQLGIPFETVNLSEEYKRAVIDDFFAGYAAGITPNPDILCNREIKFKALWVAVRQLEPDFVATGHYARKGQFSSHNFQKSNQLESKNSKSENSSDTIFKGRDENKDQSYFLWGIERTMLPKILFPIGDLTKPQVRALAKKLNLPTASKKDSQGICFIGPLKVRDFLTRHVTAQKGSALLPDGRAIADHEGIQFYTIGQKLGAGSVAWTGDVPPLFVAAKDLKNNRLIVGPDGLVWASELVAHQANWLIPKPTQPFAVKAKNQHNRHCNQ